MLEHFWRILLGIYSNQLLLSLCGLNLLFSVIMNVPGCSVKLLQWIFVLVLFFHFFLSTHHELYCLRLMKPLPFCMCCHGINKLIVFYIACWCNSNLSIQPSEMHIKIHYKKAILSLSSNFPLQSPQVHSEIHGLLFLWVAWHFLLTTTFLSIFRHVISGILRRYKIRYQSISSTKKYIYISFANGTAWSVRRDAACYKAPH